MLGCVASTPAVMRSAASSTALLRSERMAPGAGCATLPRPLEPACAAARQVKASTHHLVPAVPHPAVEAAYAAARQVKALRERNSVVKRKASIIINNMSKLVLNPADAAPFLPRLLPEVKKVRRGQPLQGRCWPCTCVCHCARKQQGS